MKKDVLKLKRLKQQQKKINKEIDFLSKKVTEYNVKQLVKKFEKIHQMGGDILDEAKNLVHLFYATDYIVLSDSDNGSKCFSNFVKFCKENDIRIVTQYIKYTGDEYNLGSHMYKIALDIK